MRTPHSKRPRQVLPVLVDRWEMGYRKRRAMMRSQAWAQRMVESADPYLSEVFTTYPLGANDFTLAMFLEAVDLLSERQRREPRHQHDDQHHEPPTAQHHGRHLR